MLTVQEAINLIIKKKKELKMDIKLEELKEDFEDKPKGDFTTSPDFNAQMKLNTYISRLKNGLDPHEINPYLFEYWNNRLFTDNKPTTEEDKALWDLCNVISTMNLRYKI